MVGSRPREALQPCRYVAPLTELSGWTSIHREARFWKAETGHRAESTQRAKRENGLAPFQWAHRH